MINVVAHNKPMCTELYDDIITACKIVDKKFDKCFELIESNVYSDEDGVIEYLINRNYCKDILELQFELLREIKPEFSSNEIKRPYYNNPDYIHLRYYKKIYLYINYK
ncbi:hypothetical protein [Clostridium sp. FP1]|uniref:hypothetical protein n=1 Tax=Clostridium sp. FP1 TaxID=2724076 RepID=UPI0013E98CE8|nr:hypothetical protein [Clostridium sp. FP1]MBZ9636172.1 hypothetical protein [Clostridium sp. FP1]